MLEHRLVLKDVSLFYRTVGEGEPVILIHGFGEDSAIWNDLIPALKDKYKVIIPDIMGSGRSAGILDGMSMESLAEHVKMIIEKENIAPCTIIGHSMGGYITLALAEKNPDLLKRFALFHSSAYADSEEKKEARRKNVDFIKKHGSEKFLQQSIPGLFSEESKNTKPEVISDLVSRYSTFSPSALAGYTEAMMKRPDRIEVLKTFRKPVLFILGEHDTAVPIEHGLKQCSIPEFSYIYICAHSAHMGMLEEPEFCKKAILDFLSGN